MRQIIDDAQRVYDMAAGALDSDGDSDEDSSEDSDTSSSTLDGLDPHHTTDDSGTMFQLLLPHICVNAIADYYDVKGLRQHANAKISHILETRWSPDGFMNIVQSALDSTSDTALHEIMVTAVLDHYEELIVRDDFDKVELTNSFVLRLVEQIGAKLRDAEHILDEYTRSADVRDENLLEMLTRYDCLKRHFVNLWYRSKRLDGPYV
jgi:hypothetical protein